MFISLVTRDSSGHRVGVEVAWLLGNPHADGAVGGGGGNSPCFLGSCSASYALYIGTLEPLGVSGKWKPCLNLVLLSF